ncbi:hypothetical protein [Pseudobacteroides cellulosolvens]|uniref:Uncharacterized protein n=1 Tax=Pseudobacteroides cellulosolvens ATCC 35603 = DSM 2933 TaxID=398512 RepID=A0A0L6JNL8_9FIRM|nr:hypothetical protein [Pseudobacteroides cellulosolvens]KNY27416.1 hypothetical protein Bccel_2687 [Pseudobacteroides cellulosolvens ATCC 35603 = DSM 2933]
MEVYFYIRSELAESAVDCGLKLSEHYEKVVMIDGEEKKCISTLLNPKDDLDKYKSSEYKCLKFDLPSKLCYVADKYMHIVGAGSKDAMEIYNRSITPLKDYIFGSFRLPECLVSSTIMPEQISILDKRLDSPILYDNSEELYINNIIESYKEEHGDFQDVLLYSFYSKLAEQKNFEMIVDGGNKIAIVVDKDKGKSISIKIPDLTKY